MTDIRELPIESVRPNPAQPRKVFDVAPLQELAESIREHGLMQPIKVRSDGAGGHLIVCGERRWRAHQIAGKATILAIVVRGDELSDDDLADQAIVENLHRKDISPLEEARAFQARLDAGYSVEQLARRLGMKQPHRITERTQLLKLEGHFQDALARGILSPSQAYEMSRLSPAGQKALFDAIGDGRCRTYAQLRAAATALLESEQQQGMFAPETPPSAAEVRAAKSFAQKVERIAEMVGSGFDDNEIVVARKVSPLEADVLADKLDVIARACGKLAVELRAAAVAGKRQVAYSFAFLASLLDSCSYRK